MYGAGGKAIGLQTRYHPGKQRMLLVGVGGVRRGVAVRHGKMLEHAADIQPRQGVQGFQLVDSFIKPGTHRKANAAHAGVGLEVDVHDPARPFGGRAQGPGLRQRVAGGGDVLLDEGGGVLRLHMAQNEDGQRPPGIAQLQGLGQAADGQPGRALLGEDTGALDGPMAVAVGFDDGAERQASRPLLHGPEVGPQASRSISAQTCFQRWLSAWKIPSFSVSGPQVRETLSTRFTISLMEASLVRPET